GGLGEVDRELGGAEFKTVPDFDFTSDTSIASMNPSTLTSSRKFVLLTGLPACDLVWAVSMESTNLSALVSPTKTPIKTETFPVAPDASVTLSSSTVIVCPLGTPVRLTVHWFEFGPATTLSPAVATVPQFVTS